MSRWFSFSWNFRLLALVVPAMLLLGASPPRGYPRSYGNIVEAARKEGSVTIYSTVESGDVSALLRAFKASYPFIRVDYREMDTSTLHGRIVRESDARRTTADIAWSSAIDRQVKLVNDGYAQVYASPEKPNLPPWAIWKNEAWGLTTEPVVIAYNRRLVPPADVPRSHLELEKLLRSNPARYAGRTGTYDPRLSGTGYLLLNQDYQASRDLWPLVTALGRTKVRLYAGSPPLLADLRSGRIAIAYNVLGSYAFSAAAKDPSIAVVMPNDYTLVTSRIALITREARHPNAARLLLDFMLSRKGQEALTKAHMLPSRDDVVVRAGRKPAGTIGRPVRLGAALLTNLDTMKRKRFIANWDHALAGGRSRR